MNSTPTLLIVDDEPSNFDVLEALLFHEGYLLNYAPNAEKTLRYLERWLPDVILLDVMMPGMDGIELCRRIKTQPEWQHIPVIMVTSLTAKEDLARCLEAGADDFVSKPVDAQEIRARVRSMMRIRQQYTTLQALLREKETMLQLREDMVNMVVHDLRHPLSVLMIACDILQMPNLTASHTRAKAAQIKTFAQELNVMVDSLLIMAKLETQQMVIHPTAVDLCDLARASVQDFQVLAKQQNVTLIERFPAVRRRIQGDELLLRRVIDNLLSNALKFSPRNTQVELVIEYPQPQTVRLVVKDQGLGVSESVRQRIFEKFEIGSLAQGVSQIGLGLAFCKLAVEAHAGQITVSPHEPQGSVFVVELNDDRLMAALPRPEEESVA